MSTFTAPRDRSSAAIWVAGALIWLPAIAFLALRAALPWDGAWVSVIPPRHGQMIVVQTAPGSALQTGDAIVAVAGRGVGEALPESTRAPPTQGSRPT